MPIVKFEQNARPGVIGKIRLGEVVVSSGGKEYPKETPHFVLKDAPDVAAVYGENPTELDVFFVSDDPEDVMPYFYKWYAGGTKDKDGNLIGGKLQCYGDGVEATWLAERDPITRIAPMRKCLAEACPDWNKPDGSRQCRPSMSVFVLLPRVTLLGLYQIDTGSVTAINKFISNVGTIHKQWGKLRGIPFKLFREATSITFFDKGVEKKSTHYPISIVPNPSFLKLYGGEMQDKVDALTNGVFALNRTALLEESTRDYVEHDAPQQKALPPPGIEAVAEDRDVAPLFETLCTLKGKANTPKVRLVTARQFEESTNPKAELIEYLHKQIAAAHKTVAKPAAATPEPQPTAGPAAGTAPAVNSDGLI